MSLSAYRCVNGRIEKRANGGALSASSTTSGNSANAMYPKRLADVQKDFAMLPIGAPGTMSRFDDRKSHTVDKGVM